MNAPVMTSEDQHEFAAQCLKDIGVALPYILDFQANGRVYLFDYGEVDLIDPGSELHDRIRDVERMNGCKVYAVTHEYTSFGELYSMFVVSKYAEDAPYMLRKGSNGRHLVYGYCLNATHEECSEFGYFAVDIFAGIPCRVG